MTQDAKLLDFESTLSTLTINAVITLGRNVDIAGSLQTGEDVYLGDTYTGSGKWTHLAMLGVRNNLRKAGCIEAVTKSSLDRLTPLGLGLAEAIASDLSGALTMCRGSVSNA